MAVVTLKQIAEKCGVSVATVSRILSNSAYVGKDAAKAEAVRTCAKELGYRPNYDALALKNARPVITESEKQICCYFARSESSGGNQFFEEVLRAVEHQAMVSNCALGFKVTQKEIEGLFLERKSAKNVQKGLIVIGRPETWFNEILPDLDRFYKGNIVFVGLHYMEKPFDQVICDGYKATQLALDYLYSLNHRRIAYVGETSGEVRFLCYLNFLEKKGIPIERDYIIECSMANEGGYGLGEKLLNMKGERPSAVFCANDVTAVGLLRDLNEKGVDVPGELSVISIDNLELAQNTRPMLTTIHIPTDALGKFSVKLLVSRINGEHSRNIRAHLPCKLIKRESCRKI